MRRSPGSKYHSAPVRSWLEQARRVEGRGVGQVAERRHAAVHGRGVAGAGGASDRLLARQVAGVDHAHEPEVEEADAAVAEQQVVARVRVAGGAAEVVQGAEEEAVDDLAEAVALGGAQLLDLLEARALEQLGDEHAAARQVGVHGRDMRERVPAPGARDGAMVRGLDLVVELLGHALAQLGGQRPHVQPRRQALDERQQQPQVAQVDLDRLGHAGVLDLDRYGLAVERDGTVHLSDRGGGERLVLELGEVLAQRAAQLGPDEPLEL